MKICDFTSRLPCLSCFFWAYTSEKEFVPKFPLCYCVSSLCPQPEGQTIRIRYYSIFPLISNQNFITISYHCKPTTGYRTESRPCKCSTGVPELPCPSMQTSESKPCRRVTLWALRGGPSHHTGASLSSFSIIFSGPVPSVSLVLSLLTLQPQQKLLTEPAYCALERQLVYGAAFSHWFSL